jgi:hypothetical protein
MSKYLMKLRLQKDINRHIQKDNYELRIVIHIFGYQDDIMIMS